MEQAWEDAASARYVHFPISTFVANITESPIKNDGNPCQISKTEPGNNVVGPTNAFAAVIMELKDRGWLDYGGDSWSKSTGELAKIDKNKGAIATNASVWWFTS
jgi:hypothetical protein